MTKKLLVTGGAGFIGSHLVEYLVGLGHDVRVLDDLSQGRREWVSDKAEFIQGTVTSLKDCQKAASEMEGVFHLAAMSKAGPSFELMDFCTQQNVIGTQNILAACREAGVKKLVYAASSTYYGNRPAPQIETLPPDCLNPYALSKYVGEIYCHFFTRVYGFPTACLRLFNVYGPRQPKTGAYALVMGIFRERAKAGLPLEIHGDGKQRRDFVHVEDVARAFWMAWESAAQGVTLNVGSGTNFSIQELADRISSKQHHVEKRAGDAFETLADISSIRQALHWHPEIDLETGLKKMEHTE